MSRKNLKGFGSFFLIFFWLLLSAFGQSSDGAVKEIGLEDQEELWITVYYSDLAAVTDKRKVALNSGKALLEIPGVSAEIKPETIFLKAPGLNFSRLNYDFELFTPENLLREFQGQQILIETYDSQTGKMGFEEAVLEHSGEGLILKFSDRVELFSQSSNVEVIKLPNLPVSLRQSPTLSATVSVEESFEGVMEISYLTKGLEWEVFYLVKIHGDEKALDIQGWVNLKNETGTDFKNVNLQLFAGLVNRAQSIKDATFDYYDPEETEIVFVTSSRIPIRIVDYFLYTIPFKTNLANNQEKKIGLLEAKDIPLTKTNYFYLDADGESYERDNVEFSYSFLNSEENNLGFPLPMGTINIYLETSLGRKVYLDKTRINNSPKNEEVSLELEEAYGLFVEQVEVFSHEETAIGEGGVEEDVIFQTIEVTLFNSTDKTEIITLYRQFYDEVDFKVTAENFLHAQNDATVIQWDIEVPANGQTVLRYSTELIEY